MRTSSRPFPQNGVFGNCRQPGLAHSFRKRDFQGKTFHGMMAARFDEVALEDTTISGFRF